MQFLTPSYLFILALAVPVIALHLQKKKRIILPVGYIYFWEALPASVYLTDLFRRLRNIILLILNLLIIFIAGLALSGLQIDGLTAKPGEFVIIFDNTPSMLADHAFDKAKIAARSFIDKEITYRDRLMIFDTNADMYPTPDALKISYEKEDFDLLINQLKAIKPAAKIVLITDGRIKDENLADINVLTVSDKQPNYAIIDANITDSHNVMFQLANFSDNFQELAVNIAGEKRNFSVKAGEIIQVSRKLDSEHQKIMIKVENPDPFRLDNEFLLVGRSINPLALCIVYHDVINPFLAELIDLCAKEGIIDKQASIAIKDTEFENYYEKIWKDYVFLFDGCQLRRPIDNGRFIFIGSYSDYHPYRVKQQINNPQELRILSSYMTGPTQQSVSLNISTANVFEDAGAKELLVCEKGPLALMGTRKGISYVAVGFRLNDSDFPLTVFFPIFFKEAFEHLASVCYFDKQYKLGDVIKNKNLLKDGPVEILIEDTVNESRVLQARNGSLKFDTEIKGFYQFKTDYLKEVCAVNFVDPEESNLNFKTALASYQPINVPLIYKINTLSLVSFLCIIFSLTELFLYAFLKDV